ncbi:MULTISPECIES: hypothetical protein [Hydrotalea]|nr:MULTISPECIES: hypothetical protein [Hydrotalea]
MPIKYSRSLLCNYLPFMDYKAALWRHILPILLEKIILMGEVVIG